MMADCHPGMSDTGAIMQPIHVCNHTTPEALYPFDARGIAKRFRHAAIFGASAVLPVSSKTIASVTAPISPWSSVASIVYQLPTSFTLRT